MRAPRLVVLAVDLPAMTAGFLRGLLETEAWQERGVVPQTRDEADFTNRWPPFTRAAVWRLARTRLRGEDGRCRGLCARPGALL